VASNEATGVAYARHLSILERNKQNKEQMDSLQRNRGNEGYRDNLPMAA